MSKILKSVTLGDVKNGGIFRALGKEFVKLDADEHGCLVLAKEIWTRMPFREDVYKRQILTTSLLPDGSCGTSAMEILAFQIARLRRQICFPQ